MNRKGRNRTAILSALSALRKMKASTSSRHLAECLVASGHSLCERSIRHYLNELDAEGVTARHGTRGHTITEKGLEELAAAQAFQRVGYLSAMMDRMIYDMTFDLATRTGLVVVNMSLVAPRHMAACADQVRKVFARGYAMGNLLAILAPGESLGDLTVPEDKLGVCTVCSITLNGVLLKHGVPTTSRFGGLLELRDSRPTRFAEMIHYDGTTIDPLEMFIRSGMTDYAGALRDGNGRIGASFHEMPENSRDLAVQLGDRMSAVGLGGFLAIGWPDQPVLGLPVGPGRVGVVVLGGLSPMAVLVEKGYQVLLRSLGGLLEYNRLFHFDELPKALEQYL